MMEAYVHLLVKFFVLKIKRSVMEEKMQMDVKCQIHVLEVKVESFRIT